MPVPTDTAPSAVMNLLFVSGTDTEVGKTYVACHIIRQLRSDGHRVGASKPVCSGAAEVNGRLIWEDVQQLAAAVTGRADAQNDLTDRICPQRFRAPVAPNVAARIENRDICDATLVNGIQAWESFADYVVVEGAGGLLSPISDRWLVADLVEQLAAPLLLVAASRLGAIHQTLTTVEAARARGLSIVAVVLNHVLPDVDAELHDINEQQLRRLMPDIPLFVAEHGRLIRRQGEADVTSWFRHPD